MSIGLISFAFLSFLHRKLVIRILRAQWIWVLLFSGLFALLCVARACVLESEELLPQLPLGLGQQAQQALVLPPLGARRICRISLGAHVSELRGGAPSGIKYEALKIVNNLSTFMLRGSFVPAGTPKAA